MATSKYCIIFLTLILGLFSCGPKTEIPDTTGHMGWGVGGKYQDYGQIFMTNSDGLNWYGVSGLGDLYLNELSCITAIDQNNIYAAGGISLGYGLILFSSDQGKTWTRTGSSSVLIGMKLNCIASSSTGIIMAGSDNGDLVFTKDNGLSWNKLRPDPASHISFTSVSFNKQNQALVLGNIIDSTQNNNGNAAFLIDENQVAATSLTIDPSYKGAWEQGIFLNDSLAFICGGNRIYKTTNKGLNWHNISPGDSLKVHSLSYLSGSTILACGEQGTLWISKDLGSNYTKHRPYNLSSSFKRIVTSGSNKIWIVIGDNTNYISGSILYSSNFGSNWAIQKTTPNVPLSDLCVYEQNK